MTKNRIDVSRPLLVHTTARIICSVLFLGLLGSACGSAESSKSKSPEGTSRGQDGAGGMGGADTTPECTEMAFVDKWREIREAVRLSPDNIGARANALVEAKDIESLYRLVRDDVSLVPPSVSGFSDSEVAVRWGTRGTMRSAAGTPREQADLLADLYARAGFEAEVVAGAPDPDLIDLEAELFDQPRPEFAPPLDEGELRNCIEELGGDPDDLAGEQIDASGELADELFERIWNAATPPNYPANVSTRLPNRYPIVRVRVDGDWTYANPSVRSGRFGESLLAGEIFDAAPAEEATVTIELLARGGVTSEDPEEPATLATGTWPVSEVVGRQVAVQFVSGLAPAEHWTLPFSAPRVFTSALSVQAPGLSTTDAEQLGVVGRSISSIGDSVIVTDDGLEVNGISLEHREPNPSAVSSVEHLRVTRLDSSEFPVVEVTVEAVDDSGRRVDSLSAADFIATDNSNPQGLVLLGQVAPPPRVLMIFDDSASVPEEFRDEGAVALGVAIASDIHAVAPDAEFRSAAVSSGIRVAGEWTTDLAQFENALQGLSGYGSDLWEALAEAVELEPTVIVFVTDADPVDELTPEFEATIAGSGVPVLTIGVGPYVQETMTQISALTNGSDVGVENREEATDVAVDFIQGSRGPLYTFAYTAEDDYRGDHELTLELLGAQVSTTRNYEAPVEGVSARPFSGLYLRVTHGGDSVIRRLAGVEVDAPVEEVTPADLLEVEAAFFGSAAVSFEGLGVTTGQLIDDFISNKLQIHENTLHLTDEEYVPETTPIPWMPALAALQQIPPSAFSESAVSFPDRPRIAISRVVPEYDVGVRSSVDILPLFELAGASAGEDIEAYRQVMRASVEIAVAEASTMRISTSSMLSDSALVAVQKRDDEEAFFPEASLEAWNLWDAHRQDWPTGSYGLTEPSGDAVTYWHVHAGGYVLGVLSNRTGGASELSAAERLERANRVMDAMNLYMDLVGMGYAPPTNISLFMAIQRKVLRVAAEASDIIGRALNGEDVSDAEMPDVVAALCEVPAEMACGALKAPLGQTFERAETLVGIAGGDSLLECPNPCR